MSQIIDTVSKANSIAISNQIVDKEYHGILHSFGLPYQELGNYLQVGTLTRFSGWVLHISINHFQIEELLNGIIPELIQKDVPFKMAKDRHTAIHLLDGGLGYVNIGKIIAVYPMNNADAIDLALSLGKLTAGYRGPNVPTDIPLEGAVHTHYATFNATSGDWLEEKQTIPFALPIGISWPFNEIRKPALPERKKLLNNIYKPLMIIKADAKGFVIRGIYLKGFLNIKTCLIKEGRKNMLLDKYGRDIRDRLTWQYELFSSLKDLAPMPKMFALFDENDSRYLVMEYIKGESLDKRIDTINGKTAWINLEIPKRLQLIQYLQSILQIIGSLHQHGYVHRDISPFNFLIDKNENIFLIDLELVHSMNQNRTDPAFQLGTIGYMSNEQFSCQTPTVWQDIYSLGALMLYLFTGLPPVKFDQENPERLADSIRFLTDSSSLSTLIRDCMSAIPTNRPTIDTIQRGIREYAASIINQTGRCIDNRTTDVAILENLRTVIKKASNGLADPTFTNSDKLWLSSLTQKDAFVGNDQFDRKPFVGWHTGISGILYLLARVKESGMRLEPTILDTYYENLQYLKSKLASDSSIQPGLYFGKAGIALAIASGIKSGLLHSDSQHITSVKNCFNAIPQEIDVASGIAGQGISLLSVSEMLHTKDFRFSLDAHVNSLIDQQRPDGSWPLFTSSPNKKELILGFSTGIAGIMYFLLAYMQKYPSPRVLTTCKKGLLWLSRQALNGKEHNEWPNTTGSKNSHRFNLSHGNPGIALVFLKAYDVLKNPLYKNIAEDSLYSIPEFGVYYDFSIASGLAGIGELYLYAYRILKNEIWFKRASWIAQLFEITSLRNEAATVCWAMDATFQPAPDLIVGCSGIIHFLIRYYNAINHIVNNGLNKELSSEKLPG